MVNCDSLNVVWARRVESTYSTGMYYYGDIQQRASYLTDGELLQGLIKILSADISKSFYER